MAISLKVLSRLSENQLRDLMRKKKVLGKIAELKKKGAKLAAELAKVEKAAAKLESSLAGPAPRKGRKPGRKPARGSALKAAKPRRKAPGAKAGARGLPLAVKQVLATSAAPLTAKQILDQVVKRGWKAKTKNPQLRVYAALRSIGAKKSKKGFSLE